MTTRNVFRQIEAAVQLVGLAPEQGLQICSAQQLAGRHHPPFEIGLPALVLSVLDAETAASLQNLLANAYPPAHSLQLIDTRKGETVPLPLSQLANQELSGEEVCLLIPPLPHGSYADLQEIMAHLRAPYGCPWDREQTLASSRAYLLDEVAETLEAMDAGDDHHTAEELGDVLGIVAMICQIGSEEGRFQMADTVQASVEKLIRRHPHVFGDDQVDDMGTLYKRWDEIKAAERAAQGKPPRGPLDAIPAALPALRKATELQSKASKAGLLDRAALATDNADLVRQLPEGSDETALGELLWRLVALAKKRDLDPEDALRSYLVHWRAERA